MFVHLRLHSEFSIIDGSVRIKEVVNAAAADGQGALGLTDLGNLFGGLKFYKITRQAGIKPVLGAEVFIEANEELKIYRSSKILLFAQNSKGYKNLCELLSRGWVSNAVQEQAHLKWEWLRELGEG
ncbi:MAG: PHP domain-containing protein, partial [Saezia sp.]